MKTIIFLECNISGTGVRAIKIAKERGYHTVLFTKENDFYNLLADNPTLYVDTLVELNTDCIASILSHAMELDTHGIVAFDDYRLINAAAVSHALGLPAPNLTSLATCRYKHQTRQQLHHLDANCRYKVCNINNTLDISKMCFPLVVKPCDDSGSSKVTVCHSMEDLDLAIKELTEFRTNHRGYKLSSTYLVEEFIEGDEYSAEAYWDTTLACWQILGITKKYTTSGKYSVEIGHDFPYESPLSAKIIQTVILWLTHVNLSHTVAHVEFKLHNNDIKLIEINPRVAGGMIDKLCERATGFDLIECYLSLHVKNMAYTPPRHHVPKYTAIRFLTSEKLGVITKIQVNSLSSTPLLFNFVPTPIQVNALKDSYSRLGYVITEAQEAELAAQFAEKWLKSVEIQYQEKPI
ncbi:argininosuccinate lyase [Providencia rustigianii]|uniref:ATP-grasp domain protein n=4 Tax=Providencia rustigianii TaxID=158850 RepID=D1P1Y9_9GAMM|nr:MULTISPECIES: ATP-grasp domain-containing protein [Providencia]EFB72610.1 ATP-grasp domain protein [Providencia rustigianii DSM 4541]MTC56519.1 ATP-grasp domain-containing protein [Providencia rustigianii]SPY78830.1 argininosuccinate lyase [Providencia rustigianii]SUC28513.1 argininosuccinate lyase [Providencia rustigianii]SUC36816.1 argininosuccinate lyase [Providencia rustigianii]